MSADQSRLTDDRAGESVAGDDRGGHAARADHGHTRRRPHPDETAPDRVAKADPEPVARTTRPPTRGRTDAGDGATTDRTTSR